MINRSFFSAFAILVLVLIATQSNAQCGDVSVTKSVNCENGSTTVTITPHGPNGPYHIIWEDDDTNWVKTFETPGTYQVTIWGDSCFFLATCVTTNPVCCLSAYWDSNPDDCKPSLTGSAAITLVENGVGPFTYEWHSVSDNLGIDPTIISTNASINHVAGGNYVVYIHDLGATDPNCFLEQWVYIETESTPTVSAHANALTCTTTNTTITTQVTGGPVTFLWNTGATTATLPNVGPGTYSVKVTNPNGCSDSDTITISAPAQVTLQATATPTACGENNGMINVSTNASTVTVVAPNGAIFNLNGSSTIDSLQSGVYEITATNSTGCTMVETAVVGDSDPAQNETECVTICGPQFVNGIWVSSSVTLTETLTNAFGCSFVFTTKVNLQVSDTTHQTAYTCFGGVITVNGVSYQKDTVVYVQMNGNCPGLTIWNLQFSDEPGSYSYPTVKICGGDSLATYTFTNSIGTDCPELIVVRSFEHQPYTLEYAMSSTDTICGLAVRSDSLFRQVLVDNVNCKITQPYGLLVTSVPTTTITPGPTHYFCGTPSDSVWVETSDVFDLENCSHNITGYWSVTTPQPILFRDTIWTCYTQIAQQYPKFSEGVNCNPDTLTIAMLEEKPALAFVYQDTCYEGQLPMAPITINHPGNNCLADTIIILNPHQSVTVNRHENICDGQSFMWQGDTITTPGTWTKVVGQTTSGCDSLETISVDLVYGQKFSQTNDTCVQGLNPVINFVISPNGCQDTIETIWNFKPNFGSLVEKSCNGPVTDTTYNVVDQWGCVTIVTCHRERYSTDQGHEAMQVCSNAFPITWHGQMITDEGNYTAILQDASVNGCDSVVNLTVMVKPLRKGSITVKICPNEDYAWNDEFLAGSNEGETYIRIIPGIGDDCDSVLTITVIFYTNELFGFVPDSLSLQAPNGMGLGQIDEWVTGLASGDWLGSIHESVWTMVREDLFFVGSTDSTVEYLQAWVLQGPCGKEEFSRTISVKLYQEQKVDQCEILITHPNLGDWVYITVTPKDAKKFENVRYTIYNTAGGVEFSGPVSVGVQNDVLVASLEKGQMYFLGLEAKVDGTDQVLHDVINGELVPVVKKIVRQ